VKLVTVPWLLTIVALIGQSSLAAEPETLKRYLDDGWEIKGYSVYYSGFPQSSFLLQKQDQVLECYRSFTDNALSCRNISGFSIRRQ
jgi:hypothetical protein